MRLTGAAPSPRGRTHTHRHTQTHTHRHTQTHTDTHRHTQTHTHTCARAPPPAEESCRLTSYPASVPSYRRIPNPIVRGLQLGLGTLLVKKGVQLLNQDKDWSQRFLGWDGYLLAWGCFIYALLFYRSRRVPVALVLFAFGLVVAIVRNSATDVTVLDVAAHANGTVQLSDTVSACGGGANRPTQGFGIHWPTTADWATGFVHMAIPQIPLTTMNSVIAVCKLSDDLFPNMDEKHKATPRRVSPTRCPLIVPSFVLMTQDDLAYNGRGGGACCACSCKRRLQARSG